MTAASVSESQRLLRKLGFDRERCNRRSALVLLALLGLKPDDPWASSEQRLLRIVDIMEWVSANWDVHYKPNTRETIRRQTLHQFVQAHLVVENPDDPTRPVNSPNWCYQLTEQALDLIHTCRTQEFEHNLSRYLAECPGLQEAYRQERDLLKIPVTLPGGGTVDLTAGGQNILLKAMVEEFCPRFTPGGSVLYVGDAGDKWLVYERDVLESLGVFINDHGKMPDLVVHMKDKNWIVLLEAASTHGPVDSKRHIELKEVFGECTAGLIFVSCFPDQATMKKFLTAISWDTEVWTSDHPTHLIHFNGERFLGPFGD